MRSLPVILLCAFALPLLAEQRIAFDRGDDVYVANMDDSAEKKVAAGIFPAVSPDGNKVAFTSVEQVPNDSTYIRRIAVVDLGSGNVTKFEQVPSTNVYYPKWSPDGSRILFTLMQSETWGLATVAADGTGLKMIRQGKPEEVTLYSPCWARDGQSIFCQDMTNIYRINLTGQTVDTWPIHKVIKNGDMSGDSRIDVSPDGKRLLLSIEMDEEVHRKDWDGPLPALWVFDLTSQKSTRITPKSLLGWDGAWIDNANVLFETRAAGEDDDTLYRMSADGKNPKQLIKNAKLADTNAH